MKKRVVFINWSSQGGSIVSIMNAIESDLKEEYDFYYIYQVGEHSHDNYYLVAPWLLTRIYYVLARVIGIKYGLGLVPTIKMLKQIKRIEPDIVHVHCPNFYNINLYYMFERLKRKNIPVIVTNHAEFLYTGNCACALECEKYLTGCHHCERQFDIYHRYLLNHTALEWRLMRRVFKRGDFIHIAVSPWSYDRLKKAPITENCEIRLIENGIDCSVFRVRQVEKLGRRKSVLHVTSFFSDKKEDFKGGYYILEIAKRMPLYDFWIVGPQNLSEAVEISKNVVFMGRIDDQNRLAEIYNMADITILTSKKETYGMVCAESLCCGTPVVGFEAGGTESIALDEFSEFVPYGDIDGLQGAFKVLKTLFL